MKQSFRNHPGILMACCIFSLFAIFVLCICLGSVTIPIADLAALVSKIWNTRAQVPPTSYQIIVWVRLPRVLSAALVGGALSLCGASMQGLLRNPLAEGSTLGISTAASLGAVIAIAIKFSVPWLPLGGTFLLAAATSFIALLLVMMLSRKLDPTLSTNTIILVGIIFSMLANSMISLVITFAGDTFQSIIFWTMGSLAGSSYQNVAVLAVFLLPCFVLIMRFSRELNAFSIGEENARYIGVDVKRVKMQIMVLLSVLIGISVSAGGSIGFVGLIIPHITRMITGANHKRLLPASLFIGAAFLMLADLASRSLFSPLELPIGVVTSLIGCLVFFSVFYSSRKERRRA